MKRTLLTLALAALSLAVLSPCWADGDPKAGSPSSTFEINGLVREVDAGQDRLTIVDNDDHRYTVDTLGADIILAQSARSGKVTDISRGMHVHLDGTLLSGGVIAADRVRVQTDSELSAPARSIAPVPAVPMGPLTTDPAAAAPAPDPAADLDSYTGVLIDCRDQSSILRSPAPTICGPDMELLYPDRSHVPSPDEVQEESIVRYYRTLDDAQNGVAGAHPLILRAMVVLGPAQDGVQLCAPDMALFSALDKRLHYTRNWKVGFLVPADK